ncbi:MAG: glycoside hydrolase family 3 N-terminal domain-containing protein [Anaeromassilibacillus sp.]
MKRRSVLFLMIAVLLLFAVGCAAGPAKTEEPNSSSSSMSVPSESESSAPPAETEERPEEPEGSASEESDASSSGQSAVPAGPATTQELFAEGYPEAQELLENMTLEEKVAQVFLFRCPSENALAAVQTYQPGGFMLFAKDFDGKTAEQVCAEMESYQQASKIPMFLAVDEEGGTVVRVSRNANLAPKPFQSPQQVFQSGGMQAIVDDTVQKTQLLQSLGLNVNLVPVADVSTNPPTSCMRGRSARGGGNGRLLKNSVATYNQQRMACALKHFPGYGNNEDTHTGIAVDHRPYETFMESDFLPFAAGIEEGAPMVLVSHNIVNCMDSEHPASLSPEVHRVLREDLGFTGLILTDDLSMGAIGIYRRKAPVRRRSTRATTCCYLRLQADYNALLAAVQDGTVTEERWTNRCCGFWR